MYRVGIIGTGIVGSAVALLLRQNGYTISRVCSRTGSSAATLAARLNCTCVDEPEKVLAEADIVFLTTPDRELAGLANRLAGSAQLAGNQVFFHMSGALPAEVLAPLKEKGAAVGSVHPLQSFADIENAVANIPGSFFAIQGDHRATEIAFEMVCDLEGRPFMMKTEDKPLYHLGACIASNYLVGLLHFAVKIYGQIGMSAEEAVRALMPLINGTLANIEKLGPVKSLTGPVSRGDTGTIEKHLEAMESLDPRLTNLYKTLGRYTTAVALEKESIDNISAEKLLSLFREKEEAGV